MKTKELIEVLQEADPESSVYFEMMSGCCGDTMELTFDYADTIDYGGPAFSRIQFKAVPGYLSCKQVTKTKRAHKEYWANIGRVLPHTVKITEEDLDQALAYADSEQWFHVKNSENWKKNLKIALGLK